MNEDRIGLFGGTFNPIHFGHIRAAELVMETFALEKILFIPSYIPPHKETAAVAPPEDRLEMIKIAVSGHPGFIPSSLEIDEKKTSYSIYTLKKVRKAYPYSEIFFILGIDAFLEIDTWKNTQEVLQQCSFIVVSRPGYQLSEAPDVLGSTRVVHKVDENTDIKINKISGESKGIFLFSIDALNISSSEIRRRIQAGESIRALVPESIENYIKINKLYQEMK